MINKLRPWIGALLVAIFIGSFLFLLTRGVERLDEQTGAVTDNCKPTELYVIGSRGHVAQVYDCARVDE
jgi:hypothetical protein